MIVPMKKVAVIVQSKDAEGAVVRLRQEGILHVEHHRIPAGSKVQALQDELAPVAQAITIVSSPEFAKEKRISPAQLPGDQRLHACRHLVETYKRRAQLEDFSLKLQSDISGRQAWGEFNPEDIQALQAKGIFLRLYQIPAKELKDIDPRIIVKVVSVSSGLARCVAIAREKYDLPYPEIPLPKTNLSQMEEKLAESLRVRQQLTQEIVRHLPYGQDFIRFKESLEKELEFNQAILGMGRDGLFGYLAGYIPFDKEGLLRQRATQEGWGILITDPSQDDTVPTLLRHPRAISLIAPLFKLLELLPGYREMDISPLFLIFLSLFFGMIIGDAGYGMFYILLIFLLQKKFENKMLDKKIWYLLYLFSSCAVFWGLLTGTVFGAQWCQAAGLKPLAPLLNNTKFLQAFCFFVGATHLTLGHLWQASRKAPSLSALSDIGWVCILWTAYYAARLLILNDPFPHFAKWLGIAGLTLVLLFTNPQRNIIKAIGYGLGAIALGLINNFTDVVSYIRLFAVGLAGVAIADTVNTLATGLGSGIARLIVLCIGHAVNLMLGLLSVLVHGVRLNVLEFSGHAGISWSGAEYKPLKE